MYIEDNAELKKLVARQKNLYKTFTPVWCCVLNREVVFNMRGFEHLHMDGRKKRRSNADARKRLLLLQHAPMIITQSRLVKADMKRQSQTFSGKKEIYHELYMNVGTRGAMVVVTLRAIGTGPTHFYGMRYAGKKKKTV